MARLVHWLRRHDPEGIEAAVNDLPDVDALQYGTTPLLAAVNHRAVGCLQELLARGADPNVPDDGGTTPLMVAARKGALERAQVLLDAHASVDQADNTGATALWWACQQGRGRCTRLLLRRGANPNLGRTKSGRTPLHIASTRNHAKCVEVLLRSGAACDSLDSANYTPFAAACKASSGAAARVLSDRGANTDLPEEVLGPMLWNSCRYGAETCLSIYLQRRSSGFDWFDPLLTALCFEHNTCARLLVGNVDLRSACGYRVGHLVKACVQNNNSEGLRMLLHHGAGASGPALHLSARLDRKECVVALLHAGADPNCEDVGGSTPMRCAMARSAQGCVRSLLEYGGGRDVQVLDVSSLGCDVELAVAIGTSPFLREVRGVPCDCPRAIMWRAPLLKKIVLQDGTVCARAPKRRAGISVGDRVCISSTPGVWQVTRTTGRAADVVRVGSHSHDKRTRVALTRLALAGPACLAWEVVDAAAARGSARASVRLLQKGAYATLVRSRIERFLR